MMSPKNTSEEAAQEARRVAQLDQEALAAQGSTPDTELTDATSGAAAEADGLDVPHTTTHGGTTSRGAYSTDPSTGAGRYMDHTGTFGTEPVDGEGDDIDAIDPQI